jgi:hypothetical protein
LGYSGAGTFLLTFGDTLMSGLGLALVPVATASQLEEEARRAVEAQHQQPVIQGLAAHVRKRWDMMRDYKNSEITPRLLECHHARNMQYSPEKLEDIRNQGGSEIFMGVVSSKCRTATAWLRDAMLGTGADKPWSIKPTPIPDLPPGLMQALQMRMQQQLEMYYQQGGQFLDPMQLQSIAAEMKDNAMRELEHEASKRVERMERKMEDQLVEGGFVKAMHEFTDDLATYPFAVLKGPAPRKRKKMKWLGDTVELVEETRDEYERVDPFKFYWAPWGDNIDEIPCIELHQLTRDDLQAMIGVDGYSEDAIRSVLSDFSAGSTDWLNGDFETMDEVTGQDQSAASDDTVHAIQLWDSVTGRDLLDWGIDESEITDSTMSYPCEVWLVRDVVIKAVLNYDPLGRKPYFATSFEKVPGRIDGNGVADLAMDAQSMCNAAARALANNMGIASGPQVFVNVSRIPAGEDVTQMYPWKIWQIKNGDYGDTSPPMSFFQPMSNAQELLGVFERFMTLADEVTGIPRYMTGEHVPGAGRTSSGLSMLISNAGKSIKQVINNVDKDVIEPLLQRKYQRNLRYSDDPDLIGDVNIIAQGAMSLVVKEAEAVRKQEFLNLVLTNPVAHQIVGMPGAAELLRDMATNLNMNVDRIVPSREAIEQQMMQQQMMQQQMMEAQANGQATQGNGQPATNAQNLQADGSQKGGRQSNFISARPNGV